MATRVGEIVLKYTHWAVEIVLGCTHWAVEIVLGCTHRAMEIAGVLFMPEQAAGGGASVRTDQKPRVR